MKYIQMAHKNMNLSWVFLDFRFTVGIFILYIMVSLKSTFFFKIVSETFLELSIKVYIFFLFPQQKINVQTFFTKGGVHKLRLQNEVGRWSKNVHFLSTFIPQKISTQATVIQNAREPSLIQKWSSFRYSTFFFFRQQFTSYILIIQYNKYFVFT